MVRVDLVVDRRDWDKGLVEGAAAGVLLYLVYWALRGKRAWKGDK